MKVQCVVATQLVKKEPNHLYATEAVIKGFDRKLEEGRVDVDERMDR